jgi:hypothetical protein
MKTTLALPTALLALFVLTAWYGWARADSPSPIQITTADNHLHVEMNGTPFTDYWFGTRPDRPYVRPFFLPVLASDGTPVTSDQYTVKGGDHPHHQSMWVAHEDVNGVNHWLLTGKPPAQQHHIKFEKIDADGFVEDLVWDDAKAQPMLDEIRTVRFIPYEDGTRGIDVTVALTPAKEAVTLEDAKDAGLCAVRVIKAISDTSTITNSAGQQGEKACWGAPADWCDASGTINGKPYGVAMFDSPANPRHPTRWHVRQYGLLAANPFGLHEFDPKQFPKGAGDLKIEPGKTVTFSYRVIIHLGDAKTAKLDDKYKQYAAQ